MKKVLKKINDFTGDIIGRFLIDSILNGPSHWQCFKWKVEDTFKKRK